MKGIFRLALAFAGFFLLAFYASCESDPATVSVRSMLEEVVKIQNDPGLAGNEMKNTRRELIRRIILKNFDFGEMAMEALGPEQWKALAGSQRSEFRSVFQDLFLDSYSRLVLDFLKKEKIEFGSEEASRGKTIVRTAIQRLGDRIPVDYLVADRNSRWLISDVTIDGVSIVQNYRKSFSRVIRQESFGGLLRRMRLQQKGAAGGKGKGP